MNVLKTVLLILTICYLQTANAADKYLQYKYNDAVTIVISSAPCSLLDLKDNYKYSVAAFRLDGQALAGCYKKLDENFIDIQWHRGDKSVLPANAFLQPDSKVPVPKIEPSL